MIYHNQILRNDWMNRLAGWRADQLVFLAHTSEQVGLFLFKQTHILIIKHRRSPLWLGTKRDKTYNYPRAQKISEMEYLTSLYN